MEAILDAIMHRLPHGTKVKLTTVDASSAYFRLEVPREHVAAAKAAVCDNVPMTVVVDVIGKD